MSRRVSAACLVGALLGATGGCGGGGDREANPSGVDANADVTDAANVGDATHFPADAALDVTLDAPLSSDAGRYADGGSDAGAGSDADAAGTHGLLEETGNFVFMADQLSCPSGADAGTCYLQSAAAAQAMVSRFTALGAYHFLLPAIDDPAEYAVVGKAIADAGGWFYSYEGFRFAFARPDGGAFDCATYLSAFHGLLSQLKTSFPDAYRGVVLMDEPNETELADLAALRACLGSTTDLHHLLVFQNLIGLEATQGSWTGTAPADIAPPSTYGFTCSGANVNGGTQTAIAYANAWTQYVDQSASSIHPDYLGFDLYPFTSSSAPEGVSLETCEPPREYLVSSATSGAAGLAATYGAEPFTFVQDWSDVSNGGYWIEPTTDELRWFFSFSIGFGIKRFAHFVSHDFPDGTGTATGMLSPDGSPGVLYTTALAVTTTFTVPIQQAMSGYSRTDFAATWLGVPSGKYVASLSSGDVVVGEYDAAGQPPLLFVANRTVEGTPAPTTVTLGAKWTTIDVFDPTNASWMSVAAATDTFTYVGAAGSGGALYRLEP
jgi:hypothetical protein